MIYKLKLKGYYVNNEWIDYNEGELLLHDSRSQTLRVLNAQCDLELNKTGTLTFIIVPEHPYFNYICKLKSEISLYQDDVLIFTGRVLNDEFDIYNNKKVECEGVLAYLLDSIQNARLLSFSGINMFNDYLNDVITDHNNQMSLLGQNHKKFVIDECNINLDDMPTSLQYVANYEDSLTLINEHLLDAFDKTYLIVNGVDDEGIHLSYLDNATLMSRYSNANQQIVFGDNLLNIIQSARGEDIATAILPLGASETTEELENGESAEIRYQLNYPTETLLEGNIYGKSNLIYDKSKVEEYGLIIKTVIYDTVEDSSELLPLAKKELDFYKHPNISLEVNAFDLHLLDDDINSLKIGQFIRVISKPHNINMSLLIENISIDINSPDKTTIKLSTTERVFKSNTISTQNKENSTAIAKGTGSMSTTDFNKYSNNYFNSQYESGSMTDLSRYATKVEVNNAFDQLANLLGGL